ncbi:osmoprotectant ABC transporter substrate-binding protein, partial [Corynebacterium sp. 35RC1]|nr:osmoprotectant ABC transporter substrate-binding protein [Corynebacterium sp. 35RC1]
ITDPELAMETVQKGYKERFNRVWFPSYGFANTYAFMVREDYAKEHNLEKISDLVNLKDDMKVGVDTAWMDRKGDGYEDFKKKYGFEFKNIYPMELGLLYSAVKNEEMDAVLGYSTDGRINSYKLILLEDDLQLFPAYDCSPVAS